MFKFGFGAVLWHDAELSWLLTVYAASTMKPFWKCLSNFNEMLLLITTFWWPNCVHVLVECTVAFMLEALHVNLVTVKTSPCSSFNHTVCAQIYRQRGNTYVGNCRFIRISKYWKSTVFNALLLLSIEFHT